MPSLFQLIQSRLWDSILWTRNAVLSEFSELDDSSVKLILYKLEDGYNYAITRELLFVQDFLNTLPGEKKLINNQDFCLAFLQEMLLQARVDDLKTMKNYKLEYINSSNKLISKNFFIHQVVTAADVQIRTSQALCEFMKNFSCKMIYKKKHNQFTEELKYEISQFIDSYSAKTNFDKVEAQGFLKQLSDSKNPNNMLTGLVTVTNNQYENLKAMCNRILRLGDSYGSNGKILDLTINSASEFAKTSNQPYDRYLDTYIPELTELPNQLPE